MIRHAASKQFATIAGAKNFYKNKGFVVSDCTESSCIMVRCNHFTLQDAEVVINKESEWVVIAEEILVFRNC